MTHVEQDGNSLWFTVRAIIAMSRSYIRTSGSAAPYDFIWSDEEMVAMAEKKIEQWMIIAIAKATGGE